MLITYSSVLLTVFLIGIQLNEFVEGHEEGESCIVKKTQEEGSCRTLFKCNMPCSAENELPELCDGTPEDEEPLWCCPLIRNATSKRVAKCELYKEAACRVDYVSTTPDADQYPQKFPECSATTQAVIMNGEEASRKEFPHMALIGYTNGTKITFRCGGSLISDRFVLSASHCFQHSDFGAPVLVRLGEHDQNDDNEAVHVDVSIEKLTPHDKYRQQSKYYDIGLIKLNRTIKFSAAIRPACLPDEEYPIEFATATGWGYVAYKELSSVLMKVSLKMFDHDKCSDAFPPTSHELRGIREQSQFCAGSDTGSNNTCGGDSGGPLQVLHKRHFCTYTIIGITSFGSMCTNSNTRSIGVYTRVFNFVDWIESIVWP